MDYMTLKEADERRGMPPRWVDYYCAAGHIPGAVKMATTWPIPKTAKRPIDRHTKKGKAVTEQYNETDAFWIWF